MNNIESIGLCVCSLYAAHYQIRGQYPTAYPFHANNFRSKDQDSRNASFLLTHLGCYKCINPYVIAWPPVSTEASIYCLG